MYSDELRKLLRLAVPLVLVQLAQNTLTFIDTLMAGALGEGGLAGIAIGGASFHFVVFTSAGVLFAVNPLVAQAIGAERRSSVPSIVWQGLWTGLFFCVPIWAIFWYAEPILLWLGQPKEVVELSTGYLRAISWGVLPAMLNVSLRGFLEGTSNTRPILLISLAAIGLNIFFNDALMFGRYGLPAMGLVGTGIASSIVYSLIFLVTVGYIWATQRDSFAGLMRWRFLERETLFELFRVGVPIACTVGFEMALFIGTAFVMGTIGPRELAAHQVAIQSASITFMIPLGIGLATCVRVGNLAGQADLRRAKVAGYLGIGIATIAMSLSALVFLAFPMWIIRSYMDVEDPQAAEVVWFATRFIRIAGLFQVFDGVQVVASNALRGLKQTRTALNWSLISYWGIGAPVSLILAYQVGLKGSGLWYGLTVGLAAAAISLSWRFVRFGVRDA